MDEDLFIPRIMFLENQWSPKYLALFMPKCDSTIIPNVDFLFIPTVCAPKPYLEPVKERSLYPLINVGYFPKFFAEFKTLVAKG